MSKSIFLSEVIRDAEDLLKAIEDFKQAITDAHVPTPGVYSDRPYRIELLRVPLTDRSYVFDFRIIYLV